jgi:hypothetical protein
VNRKTELQTADSGNVALDLHDQLASSLGDLYNKQVVVAAEQTTRWLINTGTEKRKYRMLGIRLAQTDALVQADAGNTL